MADEFRYLLPTETILPGDEVYDISSDKTGYYWAGWKPSPQNYVFRTPLECRGRFRRPIPAEPEPAPPPEPTIDPGEGWRLLQPGEVIEDGDEFYSTSFGTWMSSGEIGGRVQRFTYRRHVSRTVDPINRPAHYTHSEVEPIDAIEAWGLGYHLGNVVKYVARHQHKGRPIEDLKKAAWYLAREIGRLEALK